MENHPGALDELRLLGFRAVPLTVVGDTTIAGFRPRELAAALKLAVQTGPRDPAETLPLLERLLAAVARAVRQMPDDRLDYHAPDRERPMGEFAYHIFRMVQRTTERINNGATAPEDQAVMDLPGRSYQSFRDIADFGEGVLAEYRAWAARQDQAALRRTPEEGTSPRSGAEQLDLIAGHTAQHLRQLYFVLEGFGIKPEDRVPDGALPPEYVLTILW